MAHIHTEQSQHDHTTSAFIVRTDTPQPTVMLHKHKVLNKWMQFGGHIELDENAWQAIERELAEEVGYDLEQLKLLQPPNRITKISEVTLIPYPLYVFSHTYQGPQTYTHFHDDICYGVVTSQEPRHKIADDESQDIKLFTVDQLNKLSPQEINANIKEVCEFVLGTALKTWEQVPAQQS